MKTTLTALVTWTLTDLLGSRDAGQALHLARRLVSCLFPASCTLDAPRWTAARHQLPEAVARVTEVCLDGQWVSIQATPWDAAQEALALARRTVADLKALAAARGVALPHQARKADLVTLLAA